MKSTSSTPDSCIIYNNTDPRLVKVIGSKRSTPESIFRVDVFGT